jgi:hypothetical protein
MTSRPFAQNSGKRTFGNFFENQTAGDYILNKKAKTTFCNPNICPITSNKTVQNESDLLLLKKSIYFTTYGNSVFFNKNNLNINLITKLNLTDVPVISNKKTGITPTTIDLSASIIPYLSYNIDPSGLLFGNTFCGINNFENFIVYNCPTVPTSI